MYDLSIQIMQRRQSPSWRQSKALLISSNSTSCVINPSKLSSYIYAHTGVIHDHIHIYNLHHLADQQYQYTIKYHIEIFVGKHGNVRFVVHASEKATHHGSPFQQLDAVQLYGPPMNYSQYYCPSPSLPTPKFIHFPNFKLKYTYFQCSNQYIRSKLLSGQSQLLFKVYGLRRTY